MNSDSGHNGTLFGTIGGTLLSVLASVHLGDIFKTVLLAVIGAVTSFAVSLLLKKITLYFKKKS
jgi:uncharacterized membrane protein YgaE (UPF0421/DUF939 family)